MNVHQPKDRVTINHQGYGFVEFLTEEDADYAIKIMNMIKLYGKPIRVNKVKLQLIEEGNFSKLDFRHQHIKRILMLARICLLVISILKLMKNCYTIHSLHLVSFFKHQKYETSLSYHYFVNYLF